MNAITNVDTNTAVATQGGYDPFAAYGQEAGSSGDFLKFSKGDWSKGQAEEAVEVGSRFVANMEDFAIGWMRWADTKPQERRMHPLLSGIRPEARDALGYDDENEWEVDSDGNLRDPWQFTNELPLADPNTGEQLVFSTASKGGIGAIGNLCKAYGRDWAKHPGLVPLIEIGTDKYKHRDASRGWIKVPVLTLVDWIDNSGMPIPDAASNDDDTETEKPAPAKANAGSKTRF